MRRSCCSLSLCREEHSFQDKWSSIIYVGPPISNGLSGTSFFFFLVFKQTYYVLRLKENLIYFQVSLCTPSENTPTESLARLVAMVFQWFHSTAYMMDDEVGSLVEKLKPQFVTKWLKTVCDVRFDVMVMCLLPKPMEFARVSGG